MEWIILCHFSQRCPYFNLHSLWFYYFVKMGFTDIMKETGIKIWRLSGTICCCNIVTWVLENIKHSLTWERGEGSHIAACICCYAANFEVSGSCARIRERAPAWYLANKRSPEFWNWKELTWVNNLNELTSGYFLRASGKKCNHDSLSLAGWGMWWNSKLW